MKMKYFICLLAIWCLHGDGASFAQKIEYTSKIPPWSPAKDECENIKNCSPRSFSNAKFDAKSDVVKLTAALSSSKLENELTKMLMPRTLKQRLEIVKTFNARSKNQDLLKRLDSKLVDGPLKQLVVGSLKPVVDFYADRLNEILSKPEMHYESLIGILGVLSNKGMQAVSDRYAQLVGQTLSKTLQDKDFDSTHAKSVCISLALGRREKGVNVDEKLVQQDVQDMIDSGPKKLDTEVYKFVIVHRNFPHILRVFENYKKLTQVDVDVALATQNPSFKKVTKSMNAIVRSRTEFLADSISESLAEENFDLFIQLIVGRSEIDLGSVLKAFRLKQGESVSTIIQKRIKSLPDSVKNAMLAFLSESV